MKPGKGSLDLLIGVGSPAKKSGKSSELVSAAEDVLSAIAEKDAEALSLALERHYEACKASHASGGDEGEAEDDEDDDEDEEY